jgi:carbonic anhydrase/acetyltransferase-like protein (isoleucine patch superfamily)
MIQNYLQCSATIGTGVRIASSAAIVGNVTLEADTSVWYNATIRADVAPVTIGEGSNIQDNAVVHVTQDIPVSIGRNVTIGHGAILHSCTIGDDCLVGMGAILLDGVILGKGSLVGAGTLVPPGKTFPPGSMIVGHPGKAVRLLTETELASIRENARHYRQLALQLPDGPFIPGWISRMP